jgi:glucuronosyltransferase
MSPPWFLVLALLPVALNDGARILGMFPFPARSHLIVHKALMFELAKRGHEITMVSAFPENKPISNYTDIPLKTDMNALSGGLGKPLADMWCKYAQVFTV